jgi:signal transduction histidine kinase
MKSFRPSLTLSILAVLSSILLLNWLLLGAISLSLSKKDFYAMKGQEGSALLATILHSAPHPFVLSNIIESGFSDVIRSLQSIPDFAGLLLVDQDGKAVYAVDDARGVDQKLVDTVSSRVGSTLLGVGAKEIHVYAPIIHDDVCIGAARIALSLVGEQERLARSQQLLMAYFVLDFLLLLGMGFVFLRRSVVAPMRRLLAAIERVAKGDYGQTVHVPGSAEVAALSDSFNAMVTTLRNNRAEVKKHVNSLEEVNRQLKEAREETIRSERLASIGLLAAGTAHEIGTPLAAIIGYAGILSDELSADPEKRDYSQRIEQEAGRIDRIVRDLLDYARPLKCQLALVEILPLIRETIALLEGQGAFKDIAVSFSVAEPLPEPYIDRFQFQQVLINLLLNARDAMPSGGSIELNAGIDEQIDRRSAQSPSGRFMGRRKEDFGATFQSTFTARETFSMLRIDIHDGGAGISPENLERIFDPFFTTKEPGKGTGLGLSIAARIIDSFGGRITVTSDPGLGSCFSIYLPVTETGGMENHEIT